MDKFYCTKKFKERPVWCGKIGWRLICVERALRRHQFKLSFIVYTALSLQIVLLSSPPFEKAGREQPGFFNIQVIGYYYGLAAIKWWPVPGEPLSSMLARQFPGSLGSPST